MLPFPLSSQPLNPTLVGSSFLSPLLGPNSLKAFVYTYFLQFFSYSLLNLS